MLKNKAFFSLQQTSNKHPNEAKRRIKIMLKKGENELPLKLNKDSNFWTKNPAP